MMTNSFGQEHVISFFVCELHIIAESSSELINKQKKMFTQEDLEQAQPHCLHATEYLIIPDDAQNTPVTTGKPAYEVVS